jgi:hypothetical protein
MQPGYTPPWHPPIHGGDPRDITALRAQRAEVDALLAFRHAEHADAAARAWWRLVRARAERLGLLGIAETASLAPLPAPPPGALTFLQRVLRKLGRFRPEAASVPPYLK